MRVCVRACVHVCLLTWFSTQSLYFHSIAKTIIKKVLRRYKEKKKGEVEEDDSFVRWEKDFEMVPLSVHGLFFEYLELGKEMCVT